MPLSEEQLHKDKIEGMKTFSDTIKHIATLSAGSIVLLVALLEKLFKNPSWSVLIPLTLLSFVVSLIAGVFTMWYVATAIRDSMRIDEESGSIGGTFAFVCVFGFILGFSFLVAFAIKNFYA